MADSDITVSGLSSAPGISYNVLEYDVADPHEDGLLNLSLDVVEVWAGQINDRNDSSVVKVAEGNKTIAVHLALGQSETWFYWIKARNKQGFYGEWYPLSPTAGIEGTTALIGAAEGGLPVLWQDYTPIVRSGSGSITAYTASGKFNQIGTTCFVNVHVDITNNGTGAGQLFVSLPDDLPPHPTTLAVGSGRRSSDSNVLRCSVEDVAPTVPDEMIVLKYDGTYPGGVTELWLSLVYELNESWTSFATFAVTPSSGSFSSITDKRGKYIILGNVIIYNFNFTIADNGTAAGSIDVELPVAASPPQFNQGAVTIAGTGARASGVASIVASGVPETACTIFGYDGAYVGGTGATVRGTIIYELASP